MTTTIMRDSVVGDAWIKQSQHAVPVQRVVNKEGQPTGDILTGPVRLSFVWLFELPRASQNQQNPKYGSALLFPPNTDFTIFYEEYYKVCATKFANYYEPTSRTYQGLHSPFRDQVEKATKYKGYTPGCTFMTCTSRFKPPVVSPAVNDVYNPIIDPAKVYGGVWAICALKPYDYGINPVQPKKGVGFGLQNVLIIGDDTILGGGPSDPNQSFAAARNITPAIIRPEIATGFAGNQPPPPPAGVPGYTQPGFAPPAPGGYAPPQMPGQPIQPPPPTPAVDDDWSWMRP